MNELALFAGAGGGLLGGKLLGWRTVCAVEIDPYARQVLMARQDDGCLPAFPVWDDVRSFDGRPWHGLVDIVTGGFPCQDISLAGSGAGLDGERSGLWSEMSRIIGEVRPRYALVENSPALTHRGLDRVLGDLAALGYDARWGVLGALHAGAPHRRHRLWILAHANGHGWQGSTGPGSHAAPSTGEHAGREIAGGDCPPADVAHAARLRREWSRFERDTPGRPMSDGGSWWDVEPSMGRVAYGVADRVDQLHCIGNGQVPAVVRLAWEILGPGGNP